MQMDQVKFILPVQPPRDYWHGRSQRDARERPEARDPHRAISVPFVAIRSTAVICDEIDNFHFGRHCAQECAEMTFNSANISIKLAEMQDLQESDRP